jgi:Mn2+/Fe2+ NRAMP family transporter
MTTKTNLWRMRMMLFLAVVGPGIITANVDNDAGGIWTYSQAGAQYGYGLLWVMLPTTLALIVVQEMSSRMGAVTGKGLSDLIREEFGFRVTFLLMVGLVITNFGNVVAEFAGIAGSMALFGIPIWVSVPICAALVWLMVVKGSYQSVEKVFLAASFIYLSYIIAGVMAHPDWKTATSATLVPPDLHLFHSSGYLYMVVGLVGTTLAPWMQLYLQATVVERSAGLYLRRRGGLVHRGSLRRHAAHAWCARSQGRSTGRLCAASAGRPICFRSVRRGALQCLPVRRLDPANFDRLCGLRRSRRGERSGQEIQRGPLLLLALYRADRGRSRCHPVA